MNKLELKHMVPYLPYQVKIARFHSDFTSFKRVDGFISIYGNELRDVLAYSNLKPILIPLTDIHNNEYINLGTLFNDLSIGEFADIYEYILNTDVLKLPYELFNWLCSKHFDIFDLISNDLAIDKNKIEKII